MGRKRQEVSETETERICKECKESTPMEAFRLSVTYRRMNKKGETVNYIYRDMLCMPCRNERNKKNWRNRKKAEKKKESKKTFWNMGSESGVPKQTFDWFFNPHYCYG